MNRLWQAFLYSWEGLRAAWKDEVAFRQEVALSLLAIPLACWLAPDRLWLALLILCALLLLVVELINTAIEAAIDRHGDDIHPLSKKAKDTASAAVLITCVINLAVWALALIS